MGLQVPTIWLPTWVRPSKTLTVSLESVESTVPVTVMLVFC